MDPKCSSESDRLFLASLKRKPCAKGASPEYPCTQYPCWPCHDFIVELQRALNDAYERGWNARIEYEKEKNRKEGE